MWLGGLLYVPVSALFFFIGTSLFAFYGAPTDNGAPSAHYQSPGNLAEVKEVVVEQRMLYSGLNTSDPDYAARAEEIRASLRLAEIGDRVFPHFIATQLPPGLTGLLIAAVFAAAMSTVSTSMNSSATLIMSDYYRRFLRPQATERQAMRVLYIGTVAWGTLGTGMSLILVKLTESALDMWWTLSGIFGGGMSGLFLLGLISRRAGNPAAATGVILGVLLIGWLTLPAFLPAWEPLVHAFMVPVMGLLTILLVGIGVSTFTSGKADKSSAPG